MVEKIDLPDRLSPAMILAGGLSRRMGGGDKSLLLLGGRPLLGHVVARIRPQVSALALNANGDATRFAASGLEVVPDSVAGFPGPLAGILAAMSWSAGAAGASHVLTVPADTPFLPRDLAARLAAAIGDVGDSAIAIRAGRRHPVIGLWPVSARDRLRAAIEVEGLRKVEAWTERLNSRCVAFDDVPQDPFFNVNTPDDLAAAEAMLAVSA